MKTTILFVLFSGIDVSDFLQCPISSAFGGLQRSAACKTCWYEVFARLLSTPKLDRVVRMTVKAMTCCGTTGVSL